MAQNVIRKGIYLTPELMEELREYAHANRQTESEVIRLALVEYFDTSHDFDKAERKSKGEELEQGQLF
jgi:predicted transcriptional regulator